MDWSELNEVLFAGSWNEDLGLHRSNFAFRGRTRAADDLSTSLVRLGGDPSAIERPLVRHFRKYAARDAVPEDSTWNWLALAQHHGLPTRLLDSTFSPYVALHFATARRDEGQDGAVWMIDYVRAHELAPKKLREQLEREGGNVFTTELLAACAAGFDELADLGDDFVVFVEPPSFDDRIVNQYALFSLMSRPDSSLDEWSAEHPDLGRKLVLPRELKADVRDKLDQANITERVLSRGSTACRAGWRGTTLRGASGLRPSGRRPLELDRQTERPRSHRRDAAARPRRTRIGREVAATVRTTFVAATRQTSRAPASRARMR